VEAEGDVGRKFMLGEEEGTDFRRRNNQRVPVYSRQDVHQEFGVQLDSVLDKLCVFGVQREGLAGRLASLHGAGEEVEG
jgi:hypothetical protein